MFNAFSSAFNANFGVLYRVITFNAPLFLIVLHLIRRDFPRRSVAEAVFWRAPREAPARRASRADCRSGADCHSRESGNLLSVRASSFFYFVLSFAGLFLIALVSSFLRSLSGDGGAFPKIESGALPLVALLCLSTAYLEEAFFRVWLFRKSALALGSVAAACAVSALLFAFFHIWEGAFGALNALCAAVFLQFIYLKTRSVHIIALSHAAYNFCACMV